VDPRRDPPADDRTTEYRREEVGAGSVAEARRDDDVPIRREGTRDVGVSEARRRFGGLDFPATIAGMLVALALVVILAGVLGAAIGAIGFQTGIEGREELSVGGLIGGLVALFLAFLFGGWAAGRMARYDGGLNGLMTVVWFILLAAILGALGAWLGAEYDVFDRIDVPQWFSSDAVTTGAIVSGIGALLVMLLAGFLGGKWGERYHRRADATIVDTRDGGLVERRYDADDYETRRDR
jgi:amino acid transporter